MKRRVRMSYDLRSVSREDTPDAPGADKARGRERVRASEPCVAALPLAKHLRRARFPLCRQSTSPMQSA